MGRQYIVKIANCFAVAIALKQNILTNEYLPATNANHISVSQVTIPHAFNHCI